MYWRSYGGATPAADRTAYPAAPTAVEPRARGCELPMARSTASRPAELAETFELGNMVSRPAIDGLKENMPAGLARQFTTIKLRRCAAVGHWINFHTDVLLRTMQVALTGPESYDGGALVSRTLRGLHFPSPPPGSATVHDSTILHGVAELTRGVRYNLD